MAAPAALAGSHHRLVATFRLTSERRVAVLKEQESIMPSTSKKSAVIGLGLLGLISGSAALAAQTTPMPKLLHEQGRYELQVDGKPYLILGAQVNNSSNWPATLDEIWPAVTDIHANTLLVPMAWEQIEPTEGTFDFGYLDTLVQQARAHNVRLGLLWFATWKNNNPNYAPSWVKVDNQRFPRVVDNKGEVLNSLSPVGSSTLTADRTAFVALMTHLKQIDGQRHTVIMVQVENEAGTFGTDRDYSPAAESLFKQAVPDTLLKAMHKSAGSWGQVFGEHAGEYFHAWSIAHYINQVAAAGKAVYDLPMYANAMLRPPLGAARPGFDYSSGGPTYNVLGIWKAAAPALDMLTPDIYMRGYQKYTTVLDQYQRHDNPLFVSETGNDKPYARYIFAALGKQAIGYSPFGIDFTPYSNWPLGARKMNPESLAPFAMNYELLQPMASRIAALSFEGKVWGASEPTDTHEQTLDLGAWRVRISYGLPEFGNEEFGHFIPKGNPEPDGGVLIAELGPNKYLVTGYHARVEFLPAVGRHKHLILDRVEQGRYENGEWKFLRLWNGDQTDWGLNFVGAPEVLHVILATY